MTSNLTSLNLITYQSHFNQVLKTHFAKIALSSSLKTAVEYSLFSKGKRFRPILSYLSAKSIDSDIDFKKIDKSAIALECLHIYSLIHDDLPAMDDDDTRHHQPSSHIAHGEDMAILVGDVLQSLAFNFIAEDDKLKHHQQLEIIQVISKNATEMVDGQALDISIKKNINQKILETMCLKKTGALLSTAVYIGGVIAGANAQQLTLFKKFGQNLGLAYQVQDDVLDVVSSNHLLGKNQGSDIKNKKQTFVDLLGIDDATTLFRKYYDDAIAILSSLNLQNNELIQLTQYLQKRQF